MSLIKKLFYVLLLLLLVFVIVVASLMYFIDPNQLKPVITKEVMKRSGYKLVIDGNLSWSFYPVLGVKADRMKVYSPGTQQAFLDLQNVRVASDPWLLIKGEQKLRGDMYVGAAKINKLNVKKIHVGIAWQDQVLNLRPIQAQLYQGKLEGDFSAGKLQQMPEWRWHIRLTDLSIKPMLADLSGTKPRVTLAGQASFNMQAQAIGMDETRVLASMKGRAGFEVRDGQLQGINLPYLVESAEALIRKKAIPMPPKTNDTDFGVLTATADIEHGIANTKDLAIAAPDFTSHGEGMIDLVQQTLNYELVVAPRKDSYAKWQIPVIVKGSLENPDVRLDTAALNAFIFKQQLNDVKEKVQKEVNKHIKNLPEQADKFIKGLTGQE